MERFNLHLKGPNLPCCFLIWLLGLQYCAAPADNEARAAEMGVRPQFVCGGGGGGNCCYIKVYVVDRPLPCTVCCMCTCYVLWMLDILTSDRTPSVVSWYP